MLKKKLNILLLTLLSVLFLGLFSTSYAALNYNEINDVVDKLCNGEIFDVGVASAVKSKIYQETNNKNLNYWCIVKSITGSSSTYNNKIMFYANRDKNPNEISLNQWTIWFYKNGNRASSGNSGYDLRTYSYYYSTLNVHFQNYFTINEGEYGGSYIIPKLDFTPNSNINNITVNNYTNVNGVFYRVTENPIWGIINNYNDLDLSLLFYNLYEVLPNETSNLLNDSLYLEFMYKSHYYIRTDVLKIKPNKLYKLELTYDENLQDYYFFVVPYGTAISSGSTINYTWNSGDSTYTIQDQMQQSQQNQDEIMGFLTSSDIPSGEQPTIQDISVPVVQDATEDFFTWLMNSILNVLYNNNDSTLEVPLYNTTHYIRSDIYKLDIEPLKTFIQARLVVYSRCSSIKIYT